MRTKLLLLATGLAVIVGALQPVATHADAVSDDQKATNYEQQWLIKEITDCLYDSKAPDKRLEWATKKNTKPSEVRPNDYTYNSGNACDQKINGRVDMLLGGKDLKGDAVSSFFSKLSYTWDSKDNRYKRSMSEPEAQTAFLKEYNGGKKPNLTTSDMTRGKVVGLLNKYCSKTSISPVSGITSTSTDYPKLGAAKKGEALEGTYYVVIKDVGDDGTPTETLYSIKSTSSSPLQFAWYDAMNSLGVGKNSTSQGSSYSATYSTITTASCVELAKKYSDGNQAAITAAEKATKEKKLTVEIQTVQDALCGAGAHSLVSVPGLSGPALKTQQCASAVSAAYRECVKEEYSIHSGKMEPPSNQTVTECLKKKHLPDVDSSLIGAAVEKAREASAKVETVKAASTSLSDDGSGEGDDGKSSCNIDGVGWMVCPVSSFLGSMLDGAYGLISKFLEVRGDPMDTADIKKAWGVFRTIANVLFVIAMLYIIYSQMTGLGASNYGIKKIVPKIILGAIAVNLSFIICQLLVDISNLLGHSIYNIMQDIVPMKDSMADGLIGLVLGGGLVISGIALTGTALVIAGLGTVLPIVFFGLMGVLLTFIILVLRQGGIIILSVIAPLAFVALLLPNTENWFKKWWKMFFGLLLVFPAIALLFGGSRLAAGLFLGTDEFIPSVFALGIMTIPLIVSPKLLRSSLDATGKLGAGLNSMASKMSGKSTSGLMSGAMKGAKESSIGQGLAAARGFRTRQRSVKWAQRRASGTGGMSKLYNTLGGGGYAKHRATEGAALENKEDEENVANELTRMKSDMGPSGILAGGDNPNYGNLTAADGGAAYQLQEALKNNDKIKARAATKLLLSQRGKGRAQLKSVIAAHQTAHGGDASKFANNAYENMQAELGGLKASDNVLDQIGYSKKTVQELQNSAGTYSSLTDQELATQAAPDLAYAADNGLISAERAQAMLSNDNLELTPEKKASLQGVVDRAQTQSGGSTPQPTTTPPTTAQDANQANPLEGGGAIQHGPAAPPDVTQQAGISIPGAGAVSDIHTRREYPNDGMRRVVQRQNRDN
ncbi:MAG TPA: hypothetical protein PKD19_00115 [Candidatus Saccharibacteria bacterium]|nr:hypothetical protein [Candidatus Saccharibacteria bacterium]HMR38184.1 hypothetical protein [Candidatus Saccharibacteria bacterium]